MRDLPDGALAQVVRTSPHVRVLRFDDRAVAYHTLNGAPVRIDSDVARLIEGLRDPKRLQDVLADATRPQMAALGDLIASRFVTGPDSDERKTWAENMENLSSGRELFSSGLAFVLTTKCNFSCSYCIADHALGDVGTLKYESVVNTVEAYISQRRTEAPSFERFTLIFSGGEALLRFEVMEKTAHYLAERHPELRVDYRLITNGSLITDKIAAFLKRFDVDVVLSLDGKQSSHDANRRFKAKGGGTWAATRAGLCKLAQAGCRVSISAVLSASDAEMFDDELLAELQSLGVTSVAINPNNLSLPGAGQRIAEQLMVLRRRARLFGIDVGGMWTAPFHQLFARERKHGNCAASSRTGMFVTPDGKVRLCDYHPTVLGAAADLAGLWQSLRGAPNPHIFGQWTQCQDCDIEGFCSPCLLETSVAPDSQSAKCEFLRSITRLLLAELAPLAPQSTEDAAMGAAMRRR